MSLSHCTIVKCEISFWASHWSMGSLRASAVTVWINCRLSPVRCSQLNLTQLPIEVGSLFRHILRDTFSSGKSDFPRDLPRAIFPDNPCGFSTVCPNLWMTLSCGLTCKEYDPVSSSSPCRQGRRASSPLVPRSPEGTLYCCYVGRETTLPALYICRGLVVNSQYRHYKQAR